MAKREKKPVDSLRTDGGAIGTRQEKLIERNKAINTLNLAKEIEKTKKNNGFVWMQNKLLRIKKQVHPDRVQLALEGGFTFAK